LIDLTGGGSGVSDQIYGDLGNDTLVAGAAGAATLTGGEGADLYVFGQTSSQIDVITDFVVGQDKIDLSALLRSVGYTGADPVADNYIKLTSYGSGSTAGVKLSFEANPTDGVAGRDIVDLKGVT